ncbi:MAG TPA: M23 family metallopeptidase [Acidobacteriota bacterium]|nr:M23 family metallopeptidase [Acidobacteriota bacterium]
MNLRNHTAPVRTTAAAPLIFSLIAAMLLALSTGAGVETGEETISFIATHRSMQPGEVVLVEASSPVPLRSLSVTAFGREFPAFTEKDGLTWTALLGIDLALKPGTYEMTLKGVDGGGKTIQKNKTIIVSSKEFLTRELSVEPKYVAPPAKVLNRIAEERKRVDGIFASITPSKNWSGPFVYPVESKVTSPFGSRSVFNGVPRNPHTGIDLRGAIGTPIAAPNAGRIVLVADLYYSGNTVIIDHGFGLYSYLSHLSEFAVEEGDVVKKGSLVGKVGATGRVTGPHLHWTVRLAGTLVDPLSLISVLESSAARP